MALWDEPADAAALFRILPAVRGGAVGARDSRDGGLAAQPLDDGCCRFHVYTMLRLPQNIVNRPVPFWEISRKVRFSANSGNQGQLKSARESPVGGRCIWLTPALPFVSFTKAGRFCFASDKAKGSLYVPKRGAKMDDRTAAQIDELDWIRRALAQPGKTQTGLAAALGRSPTVVTRILQGNRLLKLREIKAIAEYLEVDPPPLAPEVFARTTHEVLPAPLGLLVFSSVEVGPGMVAIDRVPMDAIPTPWFEPRDSFAVVAAEDSMRPAYEPGDLIIVNPRLPPKRDHDALLIGAQVDLRAALIGAEVKQPDSVRLAAIRSGSSDPPLRAMIKRLKSWDETFWFVEHFYPKNVKQKLPRSLWRAHRIVGRLTGRL
jgi:transcriptional regulator with XRE-family HTH domain